MRRLTVCAAAVCLSGYALRMPLSAELSQSAALQQIDLAERLTAGKLRDVNREVTALEGSRRGVHVTERAGPGVVWIEGSDFTEGIIEVDVRVRDVLQQSGVAFHPLAYLRRVVRRVVLRQSFAGVAFHVDPSVAPTDWVPLRVVVKGRTVRVYVGAVKSPTLEVRKLGSHDRGLIGLWVGNNSDGDFASLRLTPMK